MSDKERLDGLITKAEVTESKSETEAVTLAKLKYDAHKFYVISGSCIIAAFAVIVFLMWRYDSSSVESQSKMITVFAGIISGALGILIGRKT